jgi:hypothetical protein
MALKIKKNSENIDLKIFEMLWDMKVITFNC